MQNLLSYFNKSANDIKSIWSKSKPYTVFIFVFETIIGLSFILELLIVSNFLDAILGARLLHVMTSDIQDIFWYQVFLMVFIFVAVFISLSFSGISKRIGIVVRNLILIFSIAILAIAISPIFVFISATSSILCRVYNNKFISFAISLLIVSYCCYKLHIIIEQSIFGYLSIGNVLLFGTSLILISFFLALVPNRNFINQI